MDDFDKRRQDYYDRKVRRADETFGLFVWICIGVGVLAFVWHLLDL